MTSPTDAELLAYLDEMLSIERSRELEQQLRSREDLRQRAAGLLQERDRGGHSVGEIWRRERLSCPTREQLGRYLLQVLEPDWEEYVRFHLDLIECRFCRANLEDLRHSQTADAQQGARRQRYFESSAGLFRSLRQD